MNIKVTVLNKDIDLKVISIALEGKVDETTNFFKIMPDFSGYSNVFINCHDVLKINSTGVKQWITFFKELGKTHTLIFQSLSPFLVEQRNIMPDFLAYQYLESIEVPFKCKNLTCKKMFYVNVDTDSLFSKLNYENDSIDAHPHCPHCQSNDCFFDDIVDEYFDFLKPSDKKAA